MNSEDDPKQKLISLEDAVKQSQEKLAKLEGGSFDIKVYVQEKIKEVEQKIDSSRINVIEALGIFVALFSFIAINVQIFSKINDLSSAMWFMLAMGGVTLTILLAVEILIDSHKDHTKSEKLNWRQQLKNVFTSKLFFLILLAITQMVVGIYFTNKHQIKLNNTFNESTKFEIQADIKSNNDNSISVDNKDLKLLVPKK